MNFFKKIPGYKTNKWWRKKNNLNLLFFLFIITLALIFPTDNQTENNIIKTISGYLKYFAKRQWAGVQRYDLHHFRLEGEK
jgi:hypothetical protein